MKNAGKKVVAITSVEEPVLLDAVAEAYQEYVEAEDAAKEARRNKNKAQKSL